MPPHLSNYDLLFGAIILISALIAVFRGGVAELLSLSTWFIAVFVMRHYALFIDRFIPQFISNSLLRSLICYIVSFIAVALVMTVLKIILHKFVKSIGLSGLNYAIGGLFGIVRGIIVCALVIILIEMFNTDEQHSWQKSWLSPILTPCVGFIVDAVPERIKNINHEAGKIVQGYQGKESELESALIGK